MVINLEQQLSGHVFTFLMVFTRLSAGFMLFPGIGEAFVSQRIRLLFALAISFLLFPVLQHYIPPIPSHVGDLAKLLVIEALIGIFFGTIMRLLMDIIETTGSIIAMEVGLSNAMILNPTLASQSALPSAFLGTAGIVVLFATGLDHFLLKALVNTYEIFPVGMNLPIGDMVEAFTHTMTKCFMVGVQLASPFMIVGLLLYTALGIMQRMMPQVQLFLVMLPVQIWGGFMVFAITIGAVLAIWLQTFDDIVAQMFYR